MSRQAPGQWGTSRKGEGSKGARGGPGRRESNSQTKPAATPQSHLRGKTLSLCKKGNHDLHTGGDMDHCGDATENTGGDDRDAGARVSLPKSVNVPAMTGRLPTP